MMYRVFKKKGDKVLVYYTTKKYISGAIQGLILTTSTWHFSTRNLGLDQKWSTLDQKWSTLDQIWSTLDQNWSNPKIFFWDFCKYFFAQNSILVNYERSWKNNLWMLIPSCIFRLDQKWSRVDQIWSNLEFKVGPLLVQGGPDLVQGGPLLVQPKVSSTDYCKLCTKVPNFENNYVYFSIFHNITTFLPANVFMSWCYSSVQCSHHKEIIKNEMGFSGFQNFESDTVSRLW